MSSAQPTRLTGEPLGAQPGRISASAQPSRGGETQVDEVDQKVKQWVAKTHAGLAISLAAPAGSVPAGGAPSGVGLYLFEMLPTPPPGSARRTPSELSLRYLVTAWAETPEAAHRILAELAFDALVNSEFEVDMQGFPLSAWTAFGIPPQPSFVLRVPLKIARPVVIAKPVTQRLEIMSSPMVGLFGMVLGPGDIPLAEARIEIPALRLSAVANYQGRFSFAGLPEQGTKILRVRAKGRILIVSCDENYPDQAAPLVIHFDTLEK